MMAIGSSSSSSMLHRKEEHNEMPAPLPPKKRRNLKVLYPDVETIALSPTTLMAKNRFVCEICFKGFPREQNLHLHKRGHNLPWKLKPSTPKDDVKRKAYICPEPSCIHHNPSNSLGDLTGIKKHYSRKHCEKKYKCAKCPKMYAVQSDLKAHTKTCGEKEYHCHCGTLFSRRDSFTSHRAFCEALAGSGLLLGRPTTGAGSSINTQMSLSAPSIQNLIHTNTNTSPAIGVSQSGQNNNMISPTMGFMNCYRPSLPSLDQQNQYKYQGNLDTRFFNMDNFRNSGNGEGSTMFSLNLSSHNNNNNNTAAMMPQPSAAALLHKASLLGSTWSNINRANNFVRGYPTCFSSNAHENNIPNYFSSSDHVGSSMLNLNAGAAYEQEDSCHAGVDCHRSGATFTRDFLGVGGGINTSSDEPESTYVGRNIM